MAQLPDWLALQIDQDSKEDTSEIVIGIVSLDTHASPQPARQKLTKI